VQAWPTSRQLLDRLLPYQGIVGIIGLVWGVIWGLHLLAVAGLMMRFAPIIWLLSLAGAVVAILLGLLLGYSLIDQHVLGKNAQFSSAARPSRSSCWPAKPRSDGRRWSWAR
jgi:hypothetical protein